MTAHMTPRPAGPARVAGPVLAGVAFAVLAALTTGGWPPLEAADTAISEASRAWGAEHPDLISVVRVATDVAATLPYLTAGFLTAVLLWGRRRRPAARFVAATTVSVPVLWLLMHWLLVHPRPAGGFVVAAGNGFPSGHTSNAAAAAVAAVTLAWAGLGVRGRIALVVVAALFAVAIGASRVMVLAHWPSDVLGGWLLVLAVVPALASMTVGAVPPSTTIDEW